MATSSGNDTNDVADEPENEGTLILDATCAPQNIAFPQDINLLNEARENLESMIDQICDEYNFYKPRMYREKAREAYLALAKCRKRNGKKFVKQSVSSFVLSDVILVILICLFCTTMLF